jgi:hypothetical protein
MIGAAILLILQAAALFAGPLFLGPAAAVGTGYLLLHRICLPRIRFGALFFAVFFLSLCFMGLAESALGLSAPDYGLYALLALRGYASFLVVLAGMTMFTFVEVLCFLKKMRVPGYILTMLYLMIQDLAVFSRLAAEISRSVRGRGAGVGPLARIKLMVHASKNFIIFAALKFRYRHEYILARGLSMDLPLEDWRAREHLPQGG